MLLFWISFSGTVKVQVSPPNHEPCEKELKYLRAKYNALKDKYHNAEIQMAKLEMKVKECETTGEELKYCNNLKEEYSKQKLDEQKQYHELELNDQKKYSELQHKKQEKYHQLELEAKDNSSILSVQIGVCEERLKACNDQFNVVSDVVPVKEGSEQVTDKCPESDYACYYTKKAGHILSWMLHLGGDTKRNTE